MMGLSEIPESPFMEGSLLSAELSCGLAWRQETQRDARTSWGRVQTPLPGQAAGQYHLILI